MVLWYRNGFKKCLWFGLRSYILDIFIYNNGLAFCMKNYAFKWIVKRITASILIPLTFWFIYISISLSKMEYDETIIFFRSYFNSFLFYIMMISMLIHSRLGLQTILEDYVTSKKTLKISKLTIHYLTYTLMFLITVFIIKMIN